MMRSLAIIAALLTGDSLLAQEYLGNEIHDRDKKKLDEQLGKQATVKIYEILKDGALVGQYHGSSTDTPAALREPRLKQ